MKQKIFGWVGWVVLFAVIVFYAFIGWLVYKSIVKPVVKATLHYFAAPHNETLKTPGKSKPHK